MTIIDDRTKIAQLDKSNVLGSIEQLPQQIEQAWQESSNLTFESSSQKIQNIVFAGMGGSNLGAKVIKSIYSDQLQTPFEIISNYHLPAYVDQNTLVILSSYSGTTEEILSCAKEAQEKQARIAIISAGGDLVNFAESNNLPIYHINPTYNPSNQPRMAIGYAITGTLGLLHSLNVLSIQNQDISSCINLLRTSDKLSPESKENQAKKIATVSENKMTMIVSADHLSGAAHVFNNQLNENAKHATWEHVVPELNHHYLEALSFPQTMSSSLIFIFCNSDLYSEKIKLRMKITQELVESKGFTSLSIEAQGDTPLQQSFWLIQFGAYTNFYLAMLHGIDPAPIPNVDHFKAELAKLT